MQMPDVNILVYAHRKDAPGHLQYRRWLEALMRSESSFAISELALSGFLRIVTHPRIFDPPTPIASALTFANEVRSRPNCVVVSPGPRHSEIFTRLCARAHAKGNLVPDAYFAALAIEDS